MAEKDKKKTTPTIQNRKASFDYQIEETYEAGIALQGTEVKSVREGQVSFADSFAYMDKGEILLKDLYIKEFKFGSYNNHEATRTRKLLLKKKEIEEMITYAGDPKYLLYGTDWPISNMKSYLKFMQQLDLPDEKKELILWKNAAELYKIDVSKL